MKGEEFGPFRGFGVGFEEVVEGEEVTGGLLGGKVGEEEVEGVQGGGEVEMGVLDDQG